MERTSRVADVESSFHSKTNQRTSGKKFVWAFVSLIVGLSMLFLFISSEPIIKTSFSSIADFTNERPSEVIPPKPVINVESPAICTTPECIIVAANIIKYMDPEVEPCDDFFMSACGKFSETRYVPSYSNSYDSADRESVLADQELISALESKVSKSEAEKNLKIIYQKCLKSRSSKEEFQDLYEEIQRMGGFPAFDENWDNSTFDFTGTILAISKVMPEKLGFFGFEAIAVENLTIPYMVSQPATIRYDLKEWLTDVRVGLFCEVMKFRKEDGDIQIFKWASKQNVLSNSNWEMDIKEILNLNKRILKIQSSDSLEFMRSTEIYGFDLERFAKNVTPPGAEPFDFVVAGSDYFKEGLLNDILNSTDVRVIQNYLVARFILEMDYFVLQDLEPMQHICIKKLKKLVPGTVGMTHARRNIKAENVAAAEEIVKEMKEEYMDEFEKSDWMDETSKKQAMEKLKKMRHYVGYPKEFADSEDTYLKELYKKFDILPTDSFFKTALKIHSFYSKEFFIHSFENKSMEFTSDFFTWNAFYSNSENSLEIASLPLKTPTFDVGLPDFHKLATMGFLIGHEIGHAYDGNPKRKSVWSNETGKIFKAKTDCLKNQYDQFELHGKKVDGSLTSGENVADSLGSKIAYKALKKKLAKGKNIEMLPGLQQFTPEQMFFYSLANVWCSTPIKSGGEINALSDVHTPNHFRINGIVTNSDEFAQAFKCKPNSPMNPEKKCRIL